MPLGYSQKVKLAFDDLSYSQEKLSRYIEQNRPQIKNLTSEELAKQAGVSQPTVIRFSQKLGYGSYKKMIADLDSVDEDNDEDVDIEPGDEISDIDEKLKKQYYDAIDATFELNSEGSIQKAVTYIKHAQNIIVTGFSEKNIYFAEYLAYRLSFIGLNATAYSHRTTAFSHINMCSADDLLIILSESGETDLLINYANVAHEQDMKVLSITRKNCNTLQSSSDVNLKVLNYGNRDVMRMSMVRVSFLVVFDMLLMNTALTDYKQTERFAAKVQLQTKLNYKAKRG